HSAQMARRIHSRAHRENRKRERGAVPRTDSHEWHFTPARSRTLGPSASCGGWLQAIASAAPRANIKAILQALSPPRTSFKAWFRPRMYATESLSLKCTCWPLLVSAYRLNDALLWKTPSLVLKERDALG